MVVWVERSERSGHVCLLLRCLRVFLTEVPVESQVVRVPRNELTDVQTTLASHVTAPVKRGCGFVVDFCFLSFEVQVQTEMVCVLKHNLPLVQLGAVVVHLRSGRRIEMCNEHE